MPFMQRSYSVEELIDGYAGELDIDRNKRTHISPSEAIGLHIHTEHIRNPNPVSITPLNDLAQWTGALLMTHVNLSAASAAYMRQWMGSAVVQIMACRLFGAKPLYEPMLNYCQLDHWEQTSVKF